MNFFNYLGHTLFLLAITTVIGGVALIIAQWFADRAWDRWGEKAGMAVYWLVFVFILAIVISALRTLGFE